MNMIENPNLEQGRFSAIAVQTVQNRRAVMDNIEAPRKKYEQSIKNYMNQIREIRLARQPESLRLRDSLGLSERNIGTKIALIIAALMLGKFGLDNTPSFIVGDQMAIPTLLLVIGSTICATQAFRRGSRR